MYMYMYICIYGIGIIYDMVNLLKSATICLHVMVTLLSTSNKKTQGISRFKLPKKDGQELQMGNDSSVHLA